MGRQLLGDLCTDRHPPPDPWLGVWTYTSGGWVSNMQTWAGSGY